ncbi:hypothetical protein AVEN_129129-1 [Araneus ventricosus]|uniref:Uncharacterized protein n=1 Tax=Araneus ventricosus TaxID=182803 RepID=A0A4Y2RYP2_ARAVE|nr:hypothetical protein AVEN_129129-1 [Araneus ventricosus]
MLNIESPTGNKPARNRSLNATLGRRISGGKELVIVVPNHILHFDGSKLKGMDLMHVTSHPPTRDLPEAAIGQS